MLAKLYRLESAPPSGDAAKEYADYLWANYREYRSQLATMTTRPSDR
ncbi:MAG: hypothetical protein ACTHLZ_01965 [Tepidisphaeraceae bacterium]